MWRQKAEDAGAVALERNLEGSLVPAPDLVDEPIVARERQKALGPEDARPAGGLAVGPSGEGSGFHGLEVVPACIAHSNAIGSQEVRV